MMTVEKKVLHSDGLLEPFKPRFIKEQLLKETDVSEEQAEKIKIRVSEKIKKWMSKRYQQQSLEQRFLHN